MLFSRTNLFFLVLAASTAQGLALYPRADNETYQSNDTATVKPGEHVSLSGKPILRVDVCDSAAEPNCEAIETVANECRMITTTLQVPSFLRRSPLRS